MSSFDFDTSECRCGDDANVIKSLDETVCNYACDGNPSHGMCGSICPAEGPGIANVYIKTDAASQESQTLASQITSTPAPSALSAASEPFTSSEEGSGTEAQQTGGLISPVGPAPEIPSTFSSNPVSSETQASVPSSTVASPSGEATTPCPLESSSSSEVPPMVTVSQTTGTCTEEPVGFTTSVRTSVSSAPQSPTTVTPAMYRSDTTPAPTLQDYPDSNMSGQQAPETVNSTSDATPDTPNYISASTLWTRPSDIVSPTGQPPVPAQVTGSDSTHSIVPPLATIGGLALIAAIIV
ncbi:hypothetical protein E4U42_007157 [Claviceps africana]|uniref:WSC domain-containing protein n=1 Tax=Claviceps africana TaxID=83212 RepID=A0A8K0NFA6_9HYPO|nr:hypothetical protein E4U42_007157 [Claviceps africana]